jgi:hypothetical protein
MDETTKNNKGTDTAFELLRFYDDFTDFNDDCAFLCDAFASLIAHSEEYLDERSIQGLERHAYWLKQRVSEFKERLRQIRESDCGEIDAVSSS